MQTNDGSEADKGSLAIVLAAGEGKRMKSTLPKVLHKIAGLSLIGHVLRGLRQAGISRTAIVIGPAEKLVAEEVLAIEAAAQIFVQDQRLGTAHATLAARSAIEQGSKVVFVTFADNPLILPQTYELLAKQIEAGADVVVGGFEPSDPFGYGRLIQVDHELIAIVEQKDLRSDQLAIRLCNGGIMAFRGSHLLALLDAVDNQNQQGEYYLTDVVSLAYRRGLNCRVEVIEAQQFQGVNDRTQLAIAENILQDRLRAKFLHQGVTLLDPQSVYFSYDTEIACDVTIEPHVFIGTGVTICEGSVIHAFSHLQGAAIASNVTIGPFARLRPQTYISENSRIGNFVELKAAFIGNSVRINHLSYIGDAQVGLGVNIGAGTITCNYDGFGKYHTSIGDHSFIGANSSLVAPVTIGAGAIIGSGSVITKNVEAEALAIARSPQIQKPRWSTQFREKMRKIPKEK